MAGAASKAPYDAFFLRMLGKEANSKTHTQCIRDCFGRVPRSSVWYVCIGGDELTAAVWMAVRACFDIIRLQVMHNTRSVSAAAQPMGRHKLQQSVCDPHLLKFTCSSRGGRLRCSLLLHCS